jgi:hypothetical protein
MPQVLLDHKTMHHPPPENQRLPGLMERGAETTAPPSTPEAAAGPSARSLRRASERERIAAAQKRHHDMTVAICGAAREDGERVGFARLYLFDDMPLTVLRHADNCHRCGVSAREYAEAKAAARRAEAPFHKLQDELRAQGRIQPTGRFGGTGPWRFLDAEAEKLMDAAVRARKEARVRLGEVTCDCVKVPPYNECR